MWNSGGVHSSFWLLNVALMIIIISLISRGTYKMERRDGTNFDCKIPPFSLESKTEDNNVPHGFLGNWSAFCLPTSSNLYYHHLHHFFLTTLPSLPTKKKIQKENNLPSCSLMCFTFGHWDVYVGSYKCYFIKTVCSNQDSPNHTGKFVGYIIRPLK